MRAVVLCADDFGLTPGVSRAILGLAARGRISATSAMTTLPHCARFAPALAALGPRIGVGLHLNLTAGRPLGPMPDLAPDGLPPLGRLLRRALAGRLPAGEVADEIARQLDAFEAAFGRPPDFVDGHQHVHVLPVVRPALLDALARRGPARPPTTRDAACEPPPPACGGEGRVGGVSGGVATPALMPQWLIRQHCRAEVPPTPSPSPPRAGGGGASHGASRSSGEGTCEGTCEGTWLRDPSERPASLLRRPAAAKALVATGLARGLAREAARAGLAVNRGFSGFSAFVGDAAAVARTFEASLGGLGPAPVVMCHPGEAGDTDLAGLDPVAAARPLEAAYLASDAFARLVEERGLVLAPRPSGA